MYCDLSYSNVCTPTPSAFWLQLSDDERLTLVRNVLNTNMAALNNILLIVLAKKDGQVVVSLIEPLSADKRGTLLLDLESFLKDAIDPALVVWVEPLSDRNSLRNLRGIEVKS